MMLSGWRRPARVRVNKPDPQPRSAQRVGWVRCRIGGLSINARACAGVMMRAKIGQIFLG